MKNGSIPKAQSAAALTPASAKLIPRVIPLSKHFSEAGCLFQKSLTVGF
jgi:hypothetical protein